MVKRILVTGGAGFIGSAYVSYLLNNTDWDIVVLDRLDYSGNLNRLAEVIPQGLRSHIGVKIVYHDLKAPINSQVANRIGDVNYIVHMAAASHVDRSIADPMSFVMDNVVGTTNILDFARLNCPNLEQFLYFSTDEVFGPCTAEILGYSPTLEKGFDEYARYNSTNPYAATKAAGEELATAYRNTYKLPIVITHTMNVFGERQHPEKFIPSTISKVLRGDTVSIHAEKNLIRAGTRFYIHTDDVARCVQNIIKCDALYDFKSGRPQKWNIVGKEEIDNLELARFIAAVVGKPLIFEMVDFHSSRPGHDLRYALDGSKMKMAYQFEPSFVWKKLRQTVEWYLAHPEWLK